MHCVGKMLLQNAAFKWLKFYIIYLLQKSSNHKLIFSTIMYYNGLLQKFKKKLYFLIIWKDLGNKF